jgi:hypothetical protein
VKLARALDLYTESLHLKQVLGDCRGEGTALIGLGNLAYKGSWLDEALDYYRQRLQMGRELGDRYGEGLTLVSITGCMPSRETPERLLTTGGKRSECWAPSTFPRHRKWRRG